MKAVYCFAILLGGGSSVGTAPYNSVTFPESFSSDHKEQTLTNVNVEDILKRLSWFEIDSHVDVVLVGDIFTKDFSNSLEDQLQTLSDVALKRSPPKQMVHEKLLFHVHRLRNEIRVALAEELARNNSVDPAKVEAFLTTTQRSISATTTLFVLHDVIPPDLSYSSPVDYCSPRSFLSMESVAWMDISGSFPSILPVSNVKNLLPPPNVAELLSTDRKTVNLPVLASLIYRSGESLFPFPLLKSHLGLGSHDQASTDVNSENVSLLHVTICVDDMFPGEMSACKEEDSARHATITTQVFHGDSTKNMFSTSYLMSTSAEVDVHYAVNAARRQTKQASASTVLLSSSELLSRLVNARSFQELVWKKMFQKTTEEEEKVVYKVIPVISLKFPVDVSVYLDDYEYSALAQMPLPSSPGKLDEDIQVGSNWRLFWPESAVVSVSPTLPYREPSNRQIELLQSWAKGEYLYTGVSCDGRGLPGGQHFLYDQVMHFIREAIWGILPPFLHYSSKSSSIVLDYLWYPLPILRRGEATKYENFREHRSVERTILFNRCEELLKQLRDLLVEANGIVPAINMAELLEIVAESQPKAASSSSLSIPSKTKSFDGIKQQKATQNSAKEHSGVFNNLLHALDEASSALSHVRYSLARRSLSDAETFLATLQARLRRIIENRPGEIYCEGNQPHADKESGLIGMTIGSLSWIVVCAVCCALGCALGLFAKEK